jgi:hypothetical protein
MLFDLEPHVEHDRQHLGAQSLWLSTEAPGNTPLIGGRWPVLPSGYFRALT